MKAIFQKIVRLEFNRFALVGFANTVLTYLIYVIGLLFFEYTVAYTMSFVIGILISYGLNASFTFKSAFSLSQAFRYSVIYIFQYLLGIVVLYGLVSLLNISTFLAPLFVVCVTLPITFLLLKLVFQDRVCV